MRQYQFSKLTLKHLVFICLMVPLVLGCRKDNLEVLNKSIISLRWVKSYPDETIDDAVTALKWALSYIGAKYFDDQSIKIIDNIIHVNISLLGFSAESIIQLQLLNKKFKSTESFKHYQSIDLGRYITCLIGASEHYYAFVNQPENLNELTKQYTLSDKAGYVNKSSVSPKDRAIRFSSQFGLNQIFIAEEIDKVTGELLEYETINLMPNGQLRFGVYDTEGKLINSASPDVSNAGKPAKCLWCHESTLLPLFANQDNFPNFLPFISFRDSLTLFNKGLLNSQSGLSKGVDFSKKARHELTELQYISFMEPSLERLVIEWQMSEKEVLDRVNGLLSHQNHEFKFLGDLYDRNDIEELAPHKSLSVSSSVREKSIIEVNHLN